MTRLLALLALVLALGALVAAPGALASNAHPTLGELESEVMCPTCKTTLDMSSSPVATRIRAFITARIEAGDKRSAIKSKLVDEFGPAVLASPSKKGFNLLAWLLPLVGIVLGALVLGWLAWVWSRRRSGRGSAYADWPPDRPLDAELEQRVDEALARYEE